MITAKCIKNIDPWGDRETDLEIGKHYEVSSIDMGSCYTSVYLHGNERSYNSVMFEFYEDGKEIDIYSDPRFNPYLRNRR